MKTKLPRFDFARVYFILWGLVVGILTGGVISLFRVLIDKILNWFIKIDPLLIHHPWWLIMVLIGITVVGIFISWLLHTEPNISGSGIPQVEGQLEGELEMKWWPILWKKFVSGVLAIGPGLFLGREGPSIQLGAAVGQGIAENTSRSPIERRVLIASGAAAGLSAAFNAPIAGTLFVLEEVYHNFSPILWISCLASSIGADLVALKVFGLTPILHLAIVNSLPINQFWHLVVLGIILGLFGYLYQRVLLAMPHWYKKLVRIPRCLHGLVPLLLVIPIGMYMPQYLGGGNAVILNFNIVIAPLGVLIGLFVLRFVFSMVSYGSGLPGGIFLPILSLGAILGAIYGVIMVKLGLLPRVYLMNIIIFSMAGYFAGIGKAPFTAILLVTEMVGSLRHLMPLAILSLVAYMVVDILGGAPIYNSLLTGLVATSRVEHIRHPERMEVPVFLGSTLSGKQVREIKWPKDMLLIAIRRGEDEVIPHGDTIIRDGDILVIMTDRCNIARIRHKILSLSDFS